MGKSITSVLFDAAAAAAFCPTTTTTKSTSFVLIVIIIIIMLPINRLHIILCCSNFTIEIIFSSIKLDFLRDLVRRIKTTNEFMPWKIVWERETGLRAITHNLHGMVYAWCLCAVRCRPIICMNIPWHAYYLCSRLDAMGVCPRLYTVSERAYLHFHIHTHIYIYYAGNTHSIPPNYTCVYRICHSSQNINLNYIKFKSIFFFLFLSGRFFFCTHKRAAKLMMMMMMVMKKWIVAWCLALLCNVFNFLNVAVHCFAIIIFQIFTLHTLDCSRMCRRWMDGWKKRTVLREPSTPTTTTIRWLRRPTDGVKYRVHTSMH